MDFGTHDNFLSDMLKICRFVDHRCGRAKIRSRTYSSCGRSAARRQTASGSFCESEAAPIHKGTACTANPSVL